MAFALIAGVILFPILELILMVKIGSVIGILPLLLLLILMGLIGGLLLRWQGLAVARQTFGQLARQEAPVASMIDGAGLMLAGFLFVLPGFLSDILGLLLLVPAIRRTFFRHLMGISVVRGSRWTPPPAHDDPATGGQAPDRNRSPRGNSVIIDGEFERIDEKSVDPELKSRGPDPQRGDHDSRSPWRR